MADDRDPSKPRRSQTQTERDLDGMAKKRERDSAVHDAIPEDFERDPVTGNYEGEDLQRMRGKRSTGERLERLEVKHDVLVKDVTETRVAVGRIEGKLEVLPKLVSILEQGAQARSELEHVTVTTKLEVDKTREQAAIEVNKAAKLSELEISQAKELDVIKARQVRRKRNAKIVASVVGLLTSWELIKWGFPWIASHL